MHNGPGKLPYIPNRKLHKNIVTAVLISPAAFVILILIYSPETFHSVENGHQYNHIIKDTAIPIPQTIERQPTSNSESKIYIIHIWHHGSRMKRRFLHSYGRAYHDPYKFCSVHNCMLSTNDSQFEVADAVLFHLHQTKGPESLPKYHPKDQMWIFFTDESPYHTFYATNKYTMKDYNGLFNWSMTYRRGADIYIPYGRTVPLSNSEKDSLKPLPNYAKSKTRSVAVLGSNCGGQNHRWEYVRELQRFTKVDVYGRCGNLTCPGNFANDCPLINNYKFYLAFENSNCKEYITEKLWWNAYHKDSIPIVMGAPREDYEALCPPHSFIHVNDFKSPKELGKYINKLDSNDEAYNQYFRWKTNFKVLNEHGYFGSPSLHLCRICEKLNAKVSQPKIYTNLELLWNKNTDCSKPNWSKPKDKKNTKE